MPALPLGLRLLVGVHLCVLESEMLSSEIACALGSALDPMFETAESMTDAVRNLASVGDASSFATLPPLLMEDSETISCQQLWGRMKSSQVETSYQIGDVPCMSDKQLIGASVLPIGVRSYPALLFVDHDKKLVTSVVYGVPLSKLESDLYKFRSTASRIEVAWKGETLASSHLTILEMMGEYSKSIGPASVSKHLLTQEPSGYHLRRTGPSAFLWMRTASGQKEHQMLQSAVLAYFRTLNKEDVLKTPLPLPEWSQFHAGIQYSFETFFSKCDTAQAAQKLAPDSGGTTDSADSADAALSDLASELAKVPALVFAMAAMVPCKHEVKTRVKIQELTQKIKSMPDQASENATKASEPSADLPLNMSSLMECSSKLFTVRNIGQSGGASQAYSLASSMFHSSDVVVAIRDVSLDSSSALQKPIHAARTLIQNLAKRVDMEMAVLYLELGPSREIRSLKYMNAESEHDLDVDCAGRLLDCPWVFPVGLRIQSREIASFFTLEASGLVRDSLRVTPSLRQTYQISAVLEQPVVKIPSEVDFRPLDERIDKLVSAVTQLRSNGLSANLTDKTETSDKTEKTELNRLKSAKQQWKVGNGVGESGANKKAKIEK